MLYEYFCRYGGAKVGDRTMVSVLCAPRIVCVCVLLCQLDALGPAVEVLLQQLPTADQPLTTLQSAVEVSNTLRTHLLSPL